MLNRFTVFALILSLISLLRVIITIDVPSDIKLALHLASKQSWSDTESRLASNNKIAFINAGVFQLELLPGISDDLAFELMAEKRRIIAKAQWLPPNQRHQALEIAHGIGEKTAITLGRQIDFLASNYEEEDFSSLAINSH